MASSNSLFIDIKYANLLSNRLGRFRIKSSQPYVANFRCPVCGDSQKSQTKARGFFVQNGQQLRFKCFNGHPGSLFSTFLKNYDPQLYKEYLYEGFAESRKSRKSSGSTEEDVRRTDRRYDVLAKLRKLGDLSPEHPARTIISNRLLPEISTDILYYTPKFAKFVNSCQPGKLNEENDEPRLIIPFRRKDGSVFGFQGRAFGKSNLRYITIILDASETKCFGLDRINFNKRIYVLEGALDSLFVPNSLAVSHADLTSIDHLIKGKRCTYIPDKDVRNKEIVKQIQKLIALNKDVCLLPRSVSGKDINEMVMNGLDPSKVKSLIDQHTYSGARLRLEFANWKKT